MGEALKQRLKQTRFESTLQEALLNLMVAAGHVRDRVERVCEEHGITHGQYNVLRILKGVYPEGHARCDIASRMIERAPDVTRLIDRLEDQGLVERDRSDKDRRLSITRITPKGLDLLEKMRPQIEAVHQYFGERISLSDRRELSRICEGLYSQEE
ncbi:MAG TPA: MarR family transcriptional regulator [Blastocatellia bacterium]|nr:MarR family transcriptional regulator [Blastocatellia bacterium]